MTKKEWRKEHGSTDFMWLLYSLRGIIKLLVLNEMVVIQIQFLQKQMQIV
jgi:hypothetical protein